MGCKPKLRFPEFSGEWEEKKINEIFEFIPTNSFSRANLNYEYGKVKNIHYGDIHTKFTTNLDCKKVEIPYINSDVDLSKIKPQSYCKNGDLVIADASEDYDDIGKAIELRNVNDDKVLAGLHTFLFRDKSGLTVEGYRGFMLLNNDIKLQIKKIATGISVLGISKTNLSELNLKIPSLSEQEKIASFLSKVDSKIDLLEKKQELWETYKKGMIQQIFSQKLRFKDENGEDYPDWEETKFSDILFEHKTKSTGNEEVFSVSVHKGLVNQVEHLGRTFAAQDTSKYNLVKPGDIVYTKSPTGDFPLGIIKQSKLDKNVIVSPLYGVFSPINTDLGLILDSYFESPINTKNYLHPIVQKGAKNTMNISNNTFLSRSLILSIHEKEQSQIANFLSTIAKKIEITHKESELVKKFKKGLLQQMFC